MPIRTKKKRNFITSVKDCFNGLEFVIVNEDNFKREILLAIIALLMCFFLKASTWEFIIVILVISLVFLAEIINTAIEKTVDLYTSKYNETARIAKDVSAFAVFMMSAFALVIGIIIFIPKILNLIGGK